FEYSRFLLVLHVTNNAARDGARYAVVNVNCPSDQIAAKKADIIAYTFARMGGVDQKNIIGCQVAVYPCDPAGFAMTPAGDPEDPDPAPPADPFTPADTNNPPWNQATFTERIAVTIKGQYKPITPTFLFMPNLIDINVTAVMGSEG